MFDKVLVLSASSGAGHVRAAEAVEKAFVQLAAAREIRNVDTLEYTNTMFRKLYSKAYIDTVQKAPALLGWLYDKMDRPWKRERRRLAFDKLNSQRFIKMVRGYRPDIIVCTHYLPAEIISYLKAKKRLSARQAIVVTDFDIHAFWLCRHFEHYFVALEETREHLVRLGIPSDKVTVSGIPIDPVFSEPKAAEPLRKKHGLKPGVTTILISAGGFGVGPIEHLMKSLFDLKHPAQVIAVCGRSAELKRRLEKLVGKIPKKDPVSIKVLGFTREMDELMTASDILVGKPGGLTTSEALAKGLLFVIVNPIPGQEERNADHLLEEGAAIRCNNLPVLAYKIDRLLDDRKNYAAMKRNVRRLARPRAAFDIVDKLVSLQRT